MSTEDDTPPAESTMNQSNETELPIPSSPTRIILRLPVKQWEEHWFSYPTAVTAYLEWANLPVQDYRELKHNVYVEPLQALDVPQKRFHIAIGLYTLSYDVKDMANVEHKIYAALRDPDGKITVRLPRPEAHVPHILQQTREIMDEKWMWGGEYGFDRAQNK